MASPMRQLLTQAEVLLLASHYHLLKAKYEN
jgi:hypothetical protein